MRTAEAVSELFAIIGLAIGELLIDCKKYDCHAANKKKKKLKRFILFANLRNLFPPCPNDIFTILTTVKTIFKEVLKLLQYFSRKERTSMSIVFCVFFPPNLFLLFFQAINL